MSNPTQILEQIAAGTSQIIPQQELLKKLESGKKLKIKLGMDPTSPDLHLGHAVVLGKLKQFQDLGHEVIFLIGDFTARIGDPTGKSKTRPALTEEEITRNMQTYFEQVGKILDPSRVIVRYNSEWCDALSIKDMVKLLGKVTLARIIEREDFANRIEHNQPVGFHEALEFNDVDQVYNFSYSQSLPPDHQDFIGIRLAKRQNAKVFPSESLSTSADHSGGSQLIENVNCVFFGHGNDYNDQDCFCSIENRPVEVFFLGDASALSN